jgi:hypothetical protein
MPIHNHPAVERLQAARVAECLPGLLWEERVELFNRLVSATISPDELAHVATSFATVSHPQTAHKLWDLLANSATDGRRVKALLRPLQSAYFPGLEFYQLEQATPGQRKRLLADCGRIARDGTPWQRLAALAIHSGVDREGAVPLAIEVSEQDSLPEELRGDAFKVSLYCDATPQAAERAAASLASQTPAILHSALAYLTLGEGAISSLAGGISIGR